ncbi:hypothetical protein [Nostoc sp. UHCC 0251]|uniref:hypothetical protein n=1 Tax=Nostoc sp. UHCC 0251 TaxID=3110240 RepID=UPI002B201C95|nr:hypothetical protein [Nostoc sp. UHCC 0251]MEA5627092.1 hypothetical protein [Nostoc sp. UHCC 0251]
MYNIVIFDTQRLKSVSVGRRSGDRTSCSLYQLDLQQLLAIIDTVHAISICVGVARRRHRLILN